MSESQDFSYEELDELEVYAALFECIGDYLIDGSVDREKWVNEKMLAIAPTAARRLHEIRTKFQDVVYDYEQYLQEDEKKERERNRPQLDPATKAKIAFKVASNAINYVTKEYPDIAEEIRAVMEKVRPREIEAQQEETPTEH